MSQLFTSGRFKGWKDDGTPNVGGRLYTYASGTTTHQNAFTTAGLSTPCTYTPDGLDGQYIALNARGEAQVWIGSAVYTFVHKTAAGDLIDSTDGVTAAAGGGSGPNFVYNQVPAGAINGSNLIYTLPSVPNPPESLDYRVNGVGQTPGADFTLSGLTITRVSALQAASGGAAADTHLAKSYTT